MCYAKDSDADPMKEVSDRLGKIEKLLLAQKGLLGPGTDWAKDDISVKLFDEEQIQVRVRELAKEISKDYMGKELLVVGLMSGVFMFMSDLVKQIEIPHEIQFVTVSSYGKGTVSSGNVKIKKDLDTPVYGKHVLLVDEICDSGGTMASLEALMRDRGAASVKSCVLLNKTARRTVSVVPDYIGMVCPDEFVVGYGMDFVEKYRSLPYVGILKPEMYQKK